VNALTSVSPAIKEQVMMQTHGDIPAQADLVVVGGGLAGLTAAALVARAGRSVVVLEKGAHLGGRATTHVRQGVHFNLGPHALYCRGHAFRVFRELDVSFTGRFPNPGRGLLVVGDKGYAIPRGLGTLLASRLLSVREKWRFANLLSALGRLDTQPLDEISLHQWLRETAGTGPLAAVLRTLIRVSTYSDDPDRMSAGAALGQLKLALAGNVWYLDGGWQTLVDGLRDRALEHGARICTRTAVKDVQSDESGVSVRFTDGQILTSRAAVLAVSPTVACELLDLPAESSLTRWSAVCIPIRAACLDIALERLPRPEYRLAFGVDRPLYLSVHSAAAKLAPDGVAVLHAMKNLGDDRETSSEDVERELEALMDWLQPGWRTLVIERRFLPVMTVAPSLPRAEDRGLRGRPGVALAERPNVFLAGDWVGPEGMLADASAASAEESARRVLDALRKSPTRADRSPSHAGS
jgi:phytoene dehydrogenase-like protein